MSEFMDDLYIGRAETAMGTSWFNNQASSATAALVAGGSGYAVNDVVQIQGGAGRFVNVQVTSVSTGVITAFTQLTSGFYNILPFNTSGAPLASTALSGSGSGATFTLTFAAPGFSNPSPNAYGVGPIGRIYVYDVIPLALGTNNIATSQTPAAAGSLTLTAGAGVLQTLNAANQTVLRLDCPRALSVTGTTGTVAVTVTVSGFDAYGLPQTEARTGPAGATTVTFQKAFRDILSVSVSGGTTAAITVGTSDVLGLPVAVIDGGYVADIGWAGALTTDTGTFVAASQVTATSTTGDVRGTYKPSSATNGVKRLVFPVHLNAFQAGPNATRQDALGVTPA